MAGGVRRRAKDGRVGCGGRGVGARVGAGAQVRVGGARGRTYAEWVEARATRGLCPPTPGSGWHAAPSNCLPNVHQVDCGGRLRARLRRRAAPRETAAQAQRARRVHRLVVCQEYLRPWGCGNADVDARAGHSVPHGAHHRYFAQVMEILLILRGCCCTRRQPPMMMMRRGTVVLVSGREVEYSERSPSSFIGLSTGGCVADSSSSCGGGRAPPSPSSFESARVCTVIGLWVIISRLV